MLCKWELIVTYTGRRTCATNMYLSIKYTTREMMLVTGHKKAVFLIFTQLVQF